MSLAKLVMTSIKHGFQQNLANKLVLSGFSYIPFSFDVDIFAIWKSSDVGILVLQNCFDVGLSKIWLLFPQTFWQHWC